MKRTLLALILAEGLAGVAYAGQPEAPPPPPPPHSSLPPLPPLPPMQKGQSSATSAQLEVKGPVTLRADTVSADIEIVPGAGKLVKAHLVDSSGGLRLSQNGDRVEVHLDAKSGWPHVPGGIDGALRVELPAGSHVELSSASGNITVRDLGGNVWLRTASGDVHVIKAGTVEAMAVSGDVVVDGASGEVRLRTVSGDAHVTQVGGSASKLEYGTTSGDLEWKGACGGGCRIEARTMSGEVKLQMVQSSSFDLRYVTHSGDVVDDLKMQVLESESSHRGSGSLHARYGKGEGLVEAQTFSGDLHVTKK